MRFSQALDSINKNYVSGVVAFYGALNPDPWQQAHDELEKELHTQDLQKLSAAIELFHSKCIGLIDAFKRLNIPKQTPSVADAFFRSEHFFKDQSRRKKTCVICESSKDLSISCTPEDELNVFLICKQCRATK